MLSRRTLLKIIPALMGMRAAGWLLPRLGLVTLIMGANIKLPGKPWQHEEVWIFNRGRTQECYTDGVRVATNSLHDYHSKGLIRPKMDDRYFLIPS